MSSSSSLSAARRRRAGGQQPVSNTTPEKPKPQQNQQPSPRPAGNYPAPNPYMLLQQHHVKINELEKKINEITSDKNGESVPTNVSLDTGNSQMDPTNFSDMIINRIESQLDLKAFYENDTRLAGEMEELNKIVQSQQLLINEMNTTLFHVIQQLHLQEPSIDDSKDTLEAADMLVNMKNNVTFEPSVNDYTGIEDEDNLSNYEGAIDNGITTFDISYVKQSSDIRNYTNNV
jgi:hypothetical protein